MKYNVVFSESEVVTMLDDKYGRKENRQIRFNKNSTAWIDEVELSKKGNGKTVDWKNSKDAIVPFGYYGNVYQLRVLDYIVEDKKYMVLVEFNEKHYKVPLSCMKNIELARLFKEIREEKLKKSKTKKDAEEKAKKIEYINSRKQKVIEKLSINHPNTMVIGEYINTNDDIDLKCKVCNHTWSSQPANIIKGRSGSCPSCNNREVNNYDQRNAMYYTHPHIARCLVNIQDAFNEVLTESGKKLDFICRDCGTFHRKTKKSVLLADRLFCDKCDDGVSYPNKFIRNVINELSNHYDITDIEYEFKPSWANGRLYDIKFIYNGVGYIVEMDGSFHYKHNNLNKSSVVEQEIIDLEKDVYAEMNGFNMIRIDCNYNTVRERLTYIKTNIYNSILKDVFNLNLIDWNKVGIESESSLVKLVWDIINTQHDATMEYVVEKTKLSISTIHSYIKAGKELGVIRKSFKLSRKNTQQTKNVSSKNCGDDYSVIWVFKFGKLAHDKSFDNIKHLCDVSLDIFGEKFVSSKVSERLKTIGIGEHTLPYKGYTFVKIPCGESFDDYIHSINISAPVDKIVSVDESMKKKIYLEDILNNIEKGKHLDWDNAIGKKIRFNYNGIIGLVEIVNRIKHNGVNKRLVLNAYGYEFNMEIGNFKDCKFRGVYKDIVRHMIEYNKNTYELCEVD